METAVKFYKAKLHFYSDRLSPKKPPIRNSIYRFCSVDSDNVKNSQKKGLNSKSPESDYMFSDSQVRLSIWNVLAKNLSPKESNLPKS